MPNCFQLTKIGEKEPKVLQDIDVELCKLFDIPVDDKLWCHNWYNSIGLALACGKTWNEMREIFEAPETHKILDYLEANYTTNVWYEHK